MNFNDDDLTEDEAVIVHRLTQAAASPDMARNMQIEDEFLSELEERDTKLMEARKTVEKQDRELALKDKELNQKSKELESKDRAISAAVHQFTEMGVPNHKIAQLLHITEEEIKQILTLKLK